MGHDCDRGYGRPSGRPLMSQLATYRLGRTHIGFGIWDFGFLTKIDDIEFNSSDFAMISLVLQSFSGRLSIRILKSLPGGTHIFTVSRLQFMRNPG